jgi:hypothetical protein
MKIKKCALCGNSFSSSVRNQIFCRQPCVSPRLSKIEEQNKAWLERKPRKNKSNNLIFNYYKNNNEQI